MSDDRSQMMLEMLIAVRDDVRFIRREPARQNGRLAALDRMFGQFATEHAVDA